MRRLTRIFGVLACALLAPVLQSASAPAPGVPRFYRVNAEIYRGGQPTLEGFRGLARIGVKTVIDLRLAEEGIEKQKVAGLGMHYVNIPMGSHITPLTGDVQKALVILDDKSAWPVFVHCHGGEDRTGMIVACYRMLHDRWSNERALEEARADAGRRLTQAMEAFILGFHPDVDSVAPAANK